MSLELGCNTLFGSVPRPDPSGFTLEHLRVAMDKVAALGFEATEFSHILHLDDASARAAGEYCQEVGLIAWSAHSSGSGAVGTEAQREATLRDRGRCLEVTKLLGAQVMVYHVSDYSAQTYASGVPEELLNLEASVLGELARQAADLRVRIAVENGGHLGLMVYLVELVKAVDNPALGICVDTGHAALGNLGPGRAIRLAGEHLYTLHLQDNWGERDDHLPPGAGKIDWCDVGEALAEVSYDGVLLEELTDVPPAPRPYHQELEMKCGAAFGWRLQQRIKALRGQQV